MPDRPEVLVVQIKKVPGNPLKCIVPPFAARRKSVVTFEFDEEPTAKIKFLNGRSPFDLPEFPVGKRKVKDDADRDTFKLVVTWPEESGTGSGNGSGEIIP